jgi:hypothetical protein
LDAVGGAGAGRKKDIIYPNGKADVASSFLFFTNYQRLLGFANLLEKPEVKR